MAPQQGQCSRNSLAGGEKCLVVPDHRNAKSRHLHQGKSILDESDEIASPAAALATRSS